MVLTLVLPLFPLSLPTGMLGSLYLTLAVVVSILGGRMTALRRHIPQFPRFFSFQAIPEGYQMQLGGLHPMAPSTPWLCPLALVPWHSFPASAEISLQPARVKVLRSITRLDVIVKPVLNDRAVLKHVGMEPEISPRRRARP